jgi:putative phage-type endonuclease
MLTEEQLAMRKMRIGGSEIGALLGIDPHRGAMDVFTAKTLPAEARAEEPQMAWGSAVEWAIVEFHARATGLRMQRPGTLLHPKLAHVCATPDALGEKQPDAPVVIEVKNVGRWMAGGWGEEADDAPFHYLAQVHWELGATIALGLTGPEAHLVAAIAGEPPRSFTVRFDAELYEGMVEVAGRFVRDHLLTGKPPTIDGSAAAGEYIRRKYAAHDLTMLEPTPQRAALVETVKILRSHRKQLDGELHAAENALKAEIGEAAGVLGLCTWKLQKRAAHTVKESAGRVLRIIGTKEE